MEADDFADHPAVELGQGFKRVELNTDIDDLLGDRPYLVYCNQLQFLGHEMGKTTFLSATTYKCGLKLFLQNLSFQKAKYQDNSYTCTSMLYGLKFLFDRYLSHGPLHCSS